MKTFGTFINESSKLRTDADKVERALRKAGIGFTIDNDNIGYVAFILEGYEGTKIVVDGVNITVSEYGSEEFYDSFSPRSLAKAIAFIED